METGLPHPRRLSCPYLTGLPMSRKLWLLFKWHVFTLHYFGYFIVKYRLHFGQPAAYLRQFRSLRFRNSFWNFTAPALFTAFFGLVMAGNAWFGDDFLQLHPVFGLADFMPRTGRQDFLITVVIWSLMHFLYLTVGAGRNLLDYQFMAVILCVDDDSVEVERPGKSTSSPEMMISYKDLSK